MAQEIDYAALARTHGAVDSQPASGPVDYAALAKQHGATDSQPPQAAAPPPAPSTWGFLQNVATSGVRAVTGLASAVAENLPQVPATARIITTDPVNAVKGIGAEAIKAGREYVGSRYRSLGDDPATAISRTLGTLYNDPVGAALDASVLVGGAESAAKGLGMAKTAAVARKAAEVLNPVSVPIKMAGRIAAPVYESAFGPAAVAKLAKRKPGAMGRGFKAGYTNAKQVEARMEEIDALQNEAVQKAVAGHAPPSPETVTAPPSQLTLPTGPQEIPSAYTGVNDRRSAELQARFGGQGIPLRRATDVPPPASVPVATPPPPTAQGMGPNAPPFVSTKAVLEHPAYTDLLKEYQGFPEELGQITKAAEPFHIAPSAIPLEHANMMRKVYNKRTRNAFDRGQPPQPTATTEANMALRESITEEVYKAIPELKTVNAEDSDLISFHQAIQKAVNKTPVLADPFLVGGAAYGMATGYWRYAMVAGVRDILRIPAVRLRLGQVLRKAGQQSGLPTATGSVGAAMLPPPATDQAATPPPAPR